MKQCVLMLLFGCFVVLTPLEAQSRVPAYPGVIVMTQPDGSTLDIRMRGDERGHWRTTLDGFQIEQNDLGYWCYLTYNCMRGVYVSRVVAHNQGERSEQELKFLKKIAKDKRLNRFVGQEK